MSASTRRKGERGEARAESFLKHLGYEILDRNVRAGRYEIDLLCRDGECLVFVEVKSGRSDSFGHPATWVTPAKRERLRQAALDIMAREGVDNTDIRFDVVTIHRNKVEHFPNAF